jgi:hypothetical protein
MIVSHGVEPAYRECRSEEETCHKQKSRSLARSAARDRPPESAEKYGSEDEACKKRKRDREYFSGAHGGHFLRGLYEFLGIRLQPSATH